MHTTHTDFNQPVQHRMLGVYINTRHRDPQIISLPEDTVLNKWKESSLVGTHLSQHCVTASAKTTQDLPDLIKEKTEQINNEYGAQTRCLFIKYRSFTRLCLQSLCIISVIRHLDVFLPVPEQLRYCSLCLICPVGTRWIHFYMLVQFAWWHDLYKGKRSKWTTDVYPTAYISSMKAHSWTVK